MSELLRFLAVYVLLCTAFSFVTELEMRQSTAVWLEAARLEVKSHLEKDVPRAWQEVGDNVQVSVEQSVKSLERVIQSGLVELDQSLWTRILGELEELERATEKQKETTESPPALGSVITKTMNEALDTGMAVLGGRF